MYLFTWKWCIKVIGDSIGWIGVLQEQYLITVTIFLSSEKENFKSFIKNSYKKFLSFAFLTIFFTYILYPVFWKNPLLVFDAIEYMSNYFNNVCTLTLGKCMYSKDLDPTYIPIWLLVKLPMIILIGLILLPFTEKKIFVSKENFWKNYSISKFFKC